MYRTKYELLSFGIINNDNDLQGIEPFPSENFGLREALANILKRNTIESAWQGGRLRPIPIAKEMTVSDRQKPGGADRLDLLGYCKNSNSFVIYELKKHNDITGVIEQLSKYCQLFIKLKSKNTKDDKIAEMFEDFCSINDINYHDIDKAKVFGIIVSGLESIPDNSQFGQIDLIRHKKGYECSVKCDGIKEIKENKFIGTVKSFACGAPPTNQPDDFKKFLIKSGCDQSESTIKTVNDIQRKDAELSLRIQSHYFYFHLKRDERARPQPRRDFIIKDKKLHIIIYKKEECLNQSLAMLFNELNLKPGKCSVLGGKSYLIDDRTRERVLESIFKKYRGTILPISESVE